MIKHENLPFPLLLLCCRQPVGMPLRLLTEQLLRPLLTVACMDMFTAVVTAMATLQPCCMPITACV
jgi:hypothetical protein